MVSERVTWLTSLHMMVSTGKGSKMGFFAFGQYVEDITLKHAVSKDGGFHILILLLNNPLNWQPQSTTMLNSLFSVGTSDWDWSALLQRWHFDGLAQHRREGVAQSRMIWQTLLSPSRNKKIGLDILRILRQTSQRWWKTHSILEQHHLQDGIIWFAVVCWISLTPWLHEQVASLPWPQRYWFSKRRMPLSGPKVSNCPAPRSSWYH